MMFNLCNMFCNNDSIPQEKAVYKSTPLIKQIRPLLDYIALNEVGTVEASGYNIVSGFISKNRRPSLPNGRFTSLTKMTISEVLAWQDKIDIFQLSEAAGRYQIMEDTLRTMLFATANPNAKFSVFTQDTLAVELLIRRGLLKYLSNDMNIHKFALSLAKEWASLPLLGPVTKKLSGGGLITLKYGQSYYATDGLNSSHANPQTFTEILTKIKWS